MQKIVALLLLLAWPSLAAATVLSVEFKFTPFVGEPATSDQVETVPGAAQVYINGVLVSEPEVAKNSVPVLFDEREVGPSVWIPAKSLGPVLRKGRNRIRVRFQPADPSLAYRAQFRWASVTDATTKQEDSAGRLRETNQADEGVQEKKGPGPVEFEREFQADFAPDLPWHHNAPVTALTQADRKALIQLVEERAAAFRPDFSAAYRILAKSPELDIAEILKGKCLDQGYAAGLRIVTLAADQLEFLTTGNAEVVIRGKSGNLFRPAHPEVIEKVKDDAQLCLGILLSQLFPPRLAVVRGASGGWEVVY
ncbi:hypothetical protein [Geomesophilobacter sediminis]|uniref:Uncharacterized protein n=1 Tax=Geomesophilobacter sediminis TaxID=2798584 RepID=A0A8J7M0Y5_9BACT|nr:hypothetical protein [Geomesophilobacter sediminis]MBJ6726620.1 hypothetical protein [Geomesophilobacter sediminis]